MAYFVATFSPTDDSESELMGDVSCSIERDTFEDALAFARVKEVVLKVVFKPLVYRLASLLLDCD